MQRFDTRRVHKDLVKRPRPGQLVYPPAIELERDHVSGEPIRADLEVVGADRGFDQVQEAPEDSVVFQARHGPQRRLDLPAYRFLAGLIATFSGLRVEARVEKLHQLGRDGVVAGQDSRQVFLPVRDDDLAQVAPERPQEGCVAPAKPGLQHELVKSIGLRHPPEDGEERRLQPRADLADVDRGTGRAFQRHVVEPHARVPIGARGGHLIGSLVHGPEAEALQKRHPVGQGQAHAPREQFQVDALERIAGPPVQVDRAGLRVRQALDLSDVGDRLAGVEGFPVGRPERLAVAGRERSGAVAEAGGGESLSELVAPGTHERLDARLQHLARDIGRRIAVTSDDEERAGERTVRIGRVGGRDAAPIAAREELAHPPANLRVVAILRHENEHGHEPVEGIHPHQDPDAGMLCQTQDLQRRRKERALLDLEELVARVGLQDFRQGAPVEARRVESGAPEDVRHLAPKIGNGRRRARIARWREQPDDRVLAPEASGWSVELGAEVIQIGPAVDARLHARLGDHQEARPLQEGADLGRDRHEITPALEHLHGRIAQ